jgi:hypothetical protein
MPSVVGYTNVYSGTAEEITIFKFTKFSELYMSVECLEAGIDAYQLKRNTLNRTDGS